MADLGGVGRLMVGVPGGDGVEWADAGMAAGDGLALTPSDPTALRWGTPFGVSAAIRREMTLTLSGVNAGLLDLYFGETPASRPQAARRPRPRYADQEARPYIVVTRAAALDSGTTQVLVEGPGSAMFMPSAVIDVAFRGAPSRLRPRRHHSRPARLAAAFGYRRRVRNRRRRGK